MSTTAGCPGNEAQGKMISDKDYISIIQHRKWREKQVVLQQTAGCWNMPLPATTTGDDDVTGSFLHYDRPTRQGHAIRLAGASATTVQVK